MLDIGSHTAWVEKDVVKEMDMEVMAADVAMAVETLQISIVEADFKVTAVETHSVVETEAITVVELDITKVMEAETVVEPRSG